MLSLAYERAFRPVWQDELLAEMRRNSARIQRERGMPDDAAEAAADHVLSEMTRAFPDACLPREAWEQHLPEMTNDPKDRHVLAAAVAAEASHLVTGNLKHFPSASRPPGLTVLRPDFFASGLLHQDPEVVMQALDSMSKRLKAPPQTVPDLIEGMCNGTHLTGFGQQLRTMLA
jgi:predicted nucleic acid-binding protein